MRAKVRSTFDFVDTIEQAEQILEDYRASATKYQKRKYPGHFHSWDSLDGKEHKFIVCTSYRYYCTELDDGSIVPKTFDDLNVYRSIPVMMKHQGRWKYLQ